jgi:signal transduction histidine kinase
MQETQPMTTMEEVDATSIYDSLLRIRVFSQMTREDASCLGRITILRARAGAVLERSEERLAGLWCVLAGEIYGYKKEPDGSESALFHFSTGDSFGEVPLLAGMRDAKAVVKVAKDATLLELGEEAFWRLMSACPTTRRAILANMGQRLQTYQAFALHREKLISLGTLSAGLMHELNNPGTAARRAAAQLRENMVGLQQISLRFCEAEWNDDQMVCMKELQTRALAGEKPKAMSTIEQSDAEECLAEWLDEMGVANSWKMAPTLAAIGFKQADLECARSAFGGSSFSDTLNWLVSLVSSVQLVGTIEESITRVSELVMAVKKYSYNESALQCHAVDIHEGLHSTLVILGHKFRPKDLKIDKQFAAALPVIQSRGTGLTQVWTNLLDNAIDASPEGGTIHIRTWVEGGPGDGKVCVGIADEGAGIAEEHRKHIFDAFFTTKPVGVGTGLGLDIAHRIVVGSYGGEIDFTTEPGKTEFIVRIPIVK